MKAAWLLVAVVCCTVSSAFARQWHAREGGFQVEAELVDVRDGNVVLKRQDGREISVPLTKLSLGDVRYVKETLNAADNAALNKGTGRETPSDKTPEPSARANSLPKEVAAATGGPWPGKASWGGRPCPIHSKRR